MLTALEPTSPPVRSAARFGDLFRQLYPRLVGLAARLLGERAEAEDVVQEAFVKLADDPILARPDGEVAAWLRRVVLNLGLNRVRDRRRAAERLERAGRLDLALVAGEADGPAREVLRHEAREQVRSALANLPERQRACLLLRHAGHSYAEVAATLGIAVGSVGVLLARAERAFRARYRERYPDDRGTRDEAAGEHTGDRADDNHAADHRADDEPRADHHAADHRADDIHPAPAREPTRGDLP